MFNPDLSKNTLSKAERLSSKIDITKLVKTGSYGNVSGLKYAFLSNNLDYSRIIVSVPKKFFKRAVVRNLLKRRIREAYRKQKSLLSSGVDLIFIYGTKEIMDYSTIEVIVEQILKEIDLD